MIGTWRYFIGAALLAGYLLILSGAPPLAVAVGVAAAAMVVWFRRRSSRLS